MMDSEWFLRKREIQRNDNKIEERMRRARVYATCKYYPYGMDDIRPGATQECIKAVDAYYNHIRW